MPARKRIFPLLLAIVTALTFVPGVAGRAAADDVLLTFTAPATTQGEPIDLIAGTAPIGSQLHAQVVLNGDWNAAWVDVPVDPAGLWSLPLAAPTPKPSLLQVGLVVGELGNPSQETYLSYETLPDPPPLGSMTILEPVAGSDVGRAFPVSGTSENVDLNTCGVYLDASVTPIGLPRTALSDNGQRIWIADAYLRDVTEGRHAIHVSCVDPWGRRLATEPRDVVVDLTPPPPAIITAPLPGTLVTTANAEISGTGVPGSPVSGRSGDNQWTAFDPVVVGADGTWTAHLDPTYLLVYAGQRWDDHVTIWQRDAVGNASITHWTLALDLRTTTSYSDVKPKASYATDVAWFSRTGISLSSATGLFTPAAVVNRAEFARYVYRFAGSHPFEFLRSPFGDVHWNLQPDGVAYDITWDAEHGIAVSSTLPDGTIGFGPYEQMSRGEAAGWLYRLAGSPAYNPATCRVPDATRSPYRLPICWAASRGIISAQKPFKGADALTRTDTATLLHAYDQSLGRPLVW